MLMASIVIVLSSSNAKSKRNELAYVEQQGWVSAKSKVSGTGQGVADIWFGGSHVDNENVGENWLADDQVSDMSVGHNGPVTRNEGMYNSYAAEHAFWADTTNMDNLRGADATGKATPGAMEVSSTATGVTGFGNTRHTYSGDEIHSTKCTTTIGTTSAWYLVMSCSDWKASLATGTNTYPEYLWISGSGTVRRHILNAGHTAWIYSNGGGNSGIISPSGVCNVFNFKTSGDDVLSSDGTMVYDPDAKTVQFYRSDGTQQGTANPYVSSTTC